MSFHVEQPSRCDYAVSRGHLDLSRHRNIDVGSDKLTAGAIQYLHRAPCREASLRQHAIVSWSYRVCIRLRAVHTSSVEGVLPRKAELSRMVQYLKEYRQSSVTRYGRQCALAPCTRDRYGMVFSGDFGEADYM
jgi:hypothetical protein